LTGNCFTTTYSSSYVLSGIGQTVLVLVRNIGNSNNSFATMAALKMILIITMLTLEHTDLQSVTTAILPSTWGCIMGT
jgi:hypothetical protein